MLKHFRSTKIQSKQLDFVKPVYFSMVIVDIVRYSTGLSKAKLFKTASQVFTGCMPFLIPNLSKHWRHIVKHFPMQTSLCTSDTGASTCNVQAKYGKKIATLEFNNLYLSKILQHYLNYNSFSPSKSTTKNQHNLSGFHELSHFTLKPNSTNTIPVHYYSLLITRLTCHMIILMHDQLICSSQQYVN